MKIAYVHVLPLEYYPPAMNGLALLAKQPGWSVRAWTSPNTRNNSEWSDDNVTVVRRPIEQPEKSLPERSLGYVRWHMSTARELNAFKPDAVIAVEPHSTLAVWLYYTFGRHDAPLFIHHHEYYAPQDYLQVGNRLLRLTRGVERDALLERAVWVSQTNAARLRMFIDTHPRLNPGCGRILPNYPPEEWVLRGKLPRQSGTTGITRLVYVGSASFEDTFVREIASWVNARPQTHSLHIAGNNVSPDIWTWLDELGSSNITTDRSGRPYGDLPTLLNEFDVGLILYKGNTLNFVHNVPNKAIEYLACGLEVWFPPEMEAMREFAEKHPALRTREVDFKSLPAGIEEHVRRQVVDDFQFTNERAMAPLIEALRQSFDRK